MSNELDMNLLKDISAKQEVLAKKFENDVATKRDVEETVTMVKSFEQEMTKFRKSQKKNRIFGDEQTAMDFVNHLALQVESHPLMQKKGGDPFKMGTNHTLYKTAANATTSGEGAVSVPTSVSEAVSILVTEYGVARKLAPVQYFMGNQSIITLTDDATAVYTTNDTTDGTDTLQTFAGVSLTPKQILGIYRASGKVLYNSAIDIAEQIGMALVRAVARLEDKTLLFADGSSTYASQTGIEDLSTIPVTYVAGLENVTIDNLIDMPYVANVSEVADDGEYWVSRSLVPVLRKLKASTAGTYQIGFQDGQFDIAGKKVNVIKQMHSGSTHGDMVAFFGRPDIACKLGVQRDLRIELSEHVDFVKAGLVWRAVEDFAIAIPQPKALSKLRIGVNGGTITT